MRRGDLADLTAFVAVADKRSFRSAAERLGVTPSALSHTISQLEQRLGVRLLQRSTRGVSLTDACAAAGVPDPRDLALLNVPQHRTSEIEDSCLRRLRTILSRCSFGAFLTVWNDGRR
jgi:transposase-like protein